MRKVVSSRHLPADQLPAPAISTPLELPPVVVGVVPVSVLNADQKPSVYGEAKQVRKRPRDS